MGGDEFLILVKKTKEEALNLAKIILSKFETFNKSVSIGVAEKKIELKRINDLYKKADIALYTAKKNGKGTIVTNY